MDLAALEQNYRPISLAPTMPPMPKKKGNFLTSLIPSGGGIAGAAGGAAAGTAILPGIGTLAGALLGGALGGGAGKVAENAVEGNKLTSGVAGEAALNGVFGAGPLRLARVGVDAVRGVRAGTTLADALANAGTNAANMSITKSVGNKLSKSGQNLIAKEFRLTPTQQANFAKLHGEEATSVLRRYGVETPEDIQARIQPLQDSFDNVITNIPAVGKNDLAAGLKKIYQPLLKSPALFEQGLGAQIKQQADELLKLASDKTVKVAPGKFDESTLRQAIGENIAQAAQAGGKSAKAITRSMLSGKSRDAYGIVMNAFAQSPNKAEIADLVTKIVPQLEGTEKNRLVKSLVDIKDPQEAAKRIWDSIGTKTSTLEGSLPANKVNELRKTFDAAVNYTQRGAPEYNVIKKTADALRGTLQTAADKAGVKTPEGMSFKDVGKELRKLYGIDEVVGKQAYLGTGSLPLSIPQLLGTIGGGAAGGLPGIVAGGVLTSAVNSPAGRRVITNTTLKAGEKLLQKSAKNTSGAYSAKNIAKRIAPVGLVGALSNQSPDSNITQQMTQTSVPTNMNNIDTSYTNQGDLSSAVDQNSPFAPQNLQDSVQKIISNGGTLKDATEFISLADAIQKMQAPAAGSKLSSATAGTITDMNKGLQTLQDLKDMISSGNYAGGVIQGNLRSHNPFDNLFKQQQAMVNAARQIVGKALESGVLRKEDEDKYKKILPTMQDSQQVALSKLDYIQSVISRSLDRYSGLVRGGTSDTIDLPSALMSAQWAY